MEKYVIVGFSGGKDSTALLLRMIELNEQIDEILCCDTYKEFPAMYRHIEKVKEKIKDKNIKFTLLKHERTFDEWMFEYEVKRKNPDAFYAKWGKDAKGKSWATSRARWCTGRLKIDLIDKYIKDLRKKYDLVHCIGLAADEVKRLERPNAKESYFRYPLVEWGWTEQDCLEYCYSLGYDWEGLYQDFKRVSCWCCPLQPLDSLRTLRKKYPELWEELKDMDRRTWQQFRADYSVEELDKRFAYEEQRIAEGKSIKNKDFFNNLKELLKPTDET